MSTPFLLQQVLHLWQQVLPDAVLQPDTHFFLAGGDSLQLSRLLLRVQQQLGIRLELQDIGNFSTPRKMALACASGVTCADSSGGLHGKLPASAAFVASSSQQGLWWSEQQAGNAGLYNSALAVSLTGDLQVPVLAMAIDLLQQQFPVLAAGLVMDVATRQLLVRQAPTPPRLGDAITLSPQELQLFTEQWAARPFRLEIEVFRCQLLRQAPQQHSLLLCVHHCVSDGWSGGVLLSQLARNYRELCCDSHWQPEHVDQAFVQHCQHQTYWHASEEFRQRLQWWRLYLRDADAASRQLPWQPTPSCWPYVLQRMHWTLPDTLQCRLPAALVAHDCTHFSLLATALAVALRDIGCGERPLIGFPVAGRSSVHEEQSVGCYMQLLPLWLEAATASTVTDLLRRNHAAMQEVLAHAIPLPDLVRELRPSPLADGNAWFDVVLALQNFPPAVCDWSPLTAGCWPIPAKHGQYALKLEVSDSCITTEYASELIDAATVQRLLQTMQQVMLALVGCGD